MDITREELAGMIDHTLLKPTAKREDISGLCAEARGYGFATVCVNPCWVAFCTQELEGSDIKVCSVAGFPLGATRTEVKTYEARKAVEDGAEEIDMVINVGMLLAGEYDAVRVDVRAVVEASRPAHVKVILETGYLTDEEIARACELCKEVGAAFVKTSTGFGPPFEIDHVKIMRKTVGPDMGVKAASGIKDYEKACEVIEAGANRIGASSGIAILEGAPHSPSYEGPGR